MRNRRAKIVATVGPSSSTVTQLAELVRAGADTFRVNTSHLTPKQATRIYRDLDRVREITGRDVGTLVDLQGPKLRMGKAFPETDIATEQKVVLAEHPTGPDEFPVDITDFATHLHVGQRVVLGDSTPELEVTSVKNGRVTCTTVKAGRLRPRMGITVPGGFPGLPAMTRQDIEHLDAAHEHADWIALSFVRDAEDVRLLRWALQIRHSQARIIAKIERAVALDHLEEIVEHADGVMVARGDLGVEIGLASVPFAQARIIDCAQQHGKTIITATQVLESMITSEAPTRAEAGDIARALVEGTSALMLSAETATGAHPALTVSTMSDLIHEAEKHLVWATRSIPQDDPVRGSLVHAADRLAADQSIGVMLIPTDSGATARLAASLARQQLIALSPDPRVRRQLSLERGVTTTPWTEDDALHLPVHALEHVIACGLVSPGQRVVVVWNQAMEDPSSPMQMVAAFKLSTSD